MVPASSTLERPLVARRSPDGSRSAVRRRNSRPVSGSVWNPGRGSTAVPTRATIIGAITAIAIAAATIVFASSLDRVVNDGRFYGSNFDLALDFEGDVSDRPGDHRRRVVDRQRRRCRGGVVGEMTITEILVNDEAVTSLAFGGEGDTTRVNPTIAEGREPFGAGEIALGLTTMRDLGVGIGDVVSMRVDGVESEAEVVGRAVLPGVGLYQGSDRTSIGVGAIISPESLGPRHRGDEVVRPRRPGPRRRPIRVRGADDRAAQRRTAQSSSRRMLSLPTSRDWRGCVPCRWCCRPCWSYSSRARSSMPW